MNRSGLLYLAMLCGFIPGHAVDKTKGYKAWKPVFTEEELEAVRACETAKERKAMVKELRAKYLALEVGNVGSQTNRG